MQCRSREHNLLLFLQEEEFGITVGISGLEFPPQGVLVVWEWEWDDDDSSVDHVSESSCEEEGNNDHNNPYLQSDTDSDSEQELEPDDAHHRLKQTHTVTFKCIGTTHDPTAQDTLRQASSKLKDGEEVPVQIVPEPENQYDSKAIAFKCNISGKWYRIGYVVREALNDVHKALAQKRVLDVSFAWAKYMVTWMRSGPGYYAGINITIIGEWPVQVCRCASTR